MRRNDETQGWVITSSQDLFCGAAIEDAQGHFELLQLSADFGFAGSLELGGNGGVWWRG
jgi:hypothetical protein